MQILLILKSCKFSPQFPSANKIQYNTSPCIIIESPIDNQYSSRFKLAIHKLRFVKQLCLSADQFTEIRKSKCPSARLFVFTETTKFPFTLIHHFLSFGQDCGPKHQWGSLQLSPMARSCWNPVHIQFLLHNQYTTYI